VGGDALIDSETLLVTDFVNLNIKSCVRVFIGVDAHTCINIYIYTVFLKKNSVKPKIILRKSQQQAFWSSVQHGTEKQLVDERKQSAVEPARQLAGCRGRSAMEHRCST
jgi:hypothetical protein